MLTTILEVAGLLAVIIAPLAGPAKNKKKLLKVDRDVTHAHYAIDEEGNLVTYHGRELSRHEH